MASFEEIRKKVPMSDTCPFCGRKLTAENSEIDHIIPRSMGGSDEPDNLRYLCKMCNVTKADKHNRLFEYYLRLMQNKGIADETSGKKIDYMLRNMSEKDMDALGKRIEEKDPSYKRLLAYATGIAKILQEKKDEPQPDNDELAMVMEKTLKAYNNFDVDSEKRIEINGNTFIYKEGFPIDEYIDDLALFGEDEQDEIYSVYLDEEGRLVVY